MSGSSMNQTFDFDVWSNATDISLFTRRPYKPTTGPTTTLSSTTTTPASTTIIQRLTHAVTTTYNFTDYVDSNGTWTDTIPGNGTTPASTTPKPFSDDLSNLDLIWIIPILILMVLFLLGLGFLLFYCIQKTEICILKYCSCCFPCCKCCQKSSYLLRDEHAKLTDDDTNVLYMREMRTGRSRP